MGDAEKGAVSEGSVPYNYVVNRCFRWRTREASIGQLRVSAPGVDTVVVVKGT